MAKREEDAKLEEPKVVGIDWLNWPTNDSGTPRKLYVSGITKWQRNLLRSKNYEPVDVLLLQRIDDRSHREALEGWLMGMSEGSIAENPQKRKTIELELRERGLLIHKTMRIDAKVNDKETLETLLNFGQTRFTINRASKERIAAAREKSISPPSGKTDEPKVH